MPRVYVICTIYCCTVSFTSQFHFCRECELTCSAWNSEITPQCIRNH